MLYCNYADTGIYCVVFCFVFFLIFYFLYFLRILCFSGFSGFCFVFLSRWPVWWALACPDSLPLVAIMKCLSAVFARARGMRRQRMRDRGGYGNWRHNIDVAEYHLLHRPAEWHCPYSDILMYHTFAELSPCYFMYSLKRTFTRLLQFFVGSSLSWIKDCAVVCVWFIFALHQVELLLVNCGHWQYTINRN